MPEPITTLSKLAATLRHLHRALLDAQATEMGIAPGSHQLLHLAANHEQFAWLRRLSALMAGIDARIDDDTPPAAADLATVRSCLRDLLDAEGEVGPGAEFSRRYRAALQQSPEAVMAHAELRQLL